MPGNASSLLFQTERKTRREKAEKQVLKQHQKQALPRSWMSNMEDVIQFSGTYYMESAKLFETKRQRREEDDGNDDDEEILRRNWRASTRWQVCVNLDKHGSRCDPNTYPC